jgi:MoxR-like ATPase
MRDRAYVLPEDVRDLAADVIRHRLVLSYEALAEDIDSDALLARILSAVPMPEVSPHEHNVIYARPSA